MKKFILIFTIPLILLASCNTIPDNNVNYSHSLNGTTNNVNIVTKDFESVGIVFVKSVETIDSLGNHTGSKITYEMFMREAAKMEADDVVNIRIDISQKKEKVVSPLDGSESLLTTYSYTGTALAIKYKTAVLKTEAGINEKKDLSSTLVLPKDASGKEPFSRGANALIFSGILLAISGAYLMAALL